MLYNNQHYYGIARYESKEMENYNDVDNNHHYCGHLDVKCVFFCTVQLSLGTT